MAVKKTTKKGGAIILAVLALVGTLGTAAFDTLSKILTKPEKSEPSHVALPASSPTPLPATVSVTDSSVSGSVVGGNQTNTTVIVIQSDADLEHLRKHFSTLSPADAEQLFKTIGRVRGFSDEPSGDVERIKKLMTARKAELEKLGFTFGPVENLLGVKERSGSRFLTPVSKGVEIAVVAIGSQSIGSLRAMIVNEVGEVLFSDLKKSGNETVFSFTAQYTGTLSIYILADEVSAPASFALMTAQR